MKFREMDIFFTVPVDRDTLITCREKRGYTTAKMFQDVLLDQRIPITYRQIEQKGRRYGLRADTAEVIAKVLKMPVEQVFPQYQEAKREAEEKAAELYYRPFANMEERNAAIVAAMEPAKWTALKYCRMLKNEDIWYDQDEIIAIAYETLVYMADRAMKKGITKGVCFDAAVCVAIKQDFLRRRKDAGRVSKKADLVSYEAMTHLFDGIPSPDDFEDRLILREELAEAIRAMSEEQRRSKRVQDLMEDARLSMLCA